MTATAYSCTPPKADYWKIRGARAVAVVDPFAMLQRLPVWGAVSPSWEAAQCWRYAWSALLAVAGLGWQVSYAVVQRSARWSRSCRSILDR